MFRILAVLAALIFFDAHYYRGQMLVRPAAEALVFGSNAVHKMAYRVGM